MKTSILKLSMLALVVGSVGCNNKPLSLETSEITIVSGNTQQIVVNPSVEGCTFTTGNPMIAPVSVDGKVTGRIIGETTIKITNDDRKFHSECNVKVTPQYQMYQEPCFLFGATKEQIKASEKRKLFTETDTQLAYSGENDFVNAINYNFENSKLKIAIALLYKTETSNEQLTNFLKERYVITATNATIRSFRSIDQKIVGTIQSTTINNREYHIVGYAAKK